MRHLRWDRANGWHIDGHGYGQGRRKGVWGYRTPWGAWRGWRQLNKQPAVTT